MINCPTTPPCSTRVHVLETGNVPVLFSFSGMKKLGLIVGIDPKEDKLTCPAVGFVLFSS